MIIIIMNIIGLFRATERVPRSRDTNPAQLLMTWYWSVSKVTQMMMIIWQTHESSSTSLRSSWTASNVHVARWGWSSWWYRDTYLQTGFINLMILMELSASAYWCCWQCGCQNNIICKDHKKLKLNQFIIG